MSPIVMKWILILGLSALLTVETNLSYTGMWIWEDGNRSLFSLTLEQHDSVITGSHCSVMLGGNRIDAAVPGDTTISGVVKKDSSLMVTVKSGYSAATGTAKIKFVGKDSIYFEFITTPNDEYWIPNKVTLVKQTTIH